MLLCSLLGSDGVGARLSLFDLSRFLIAEPASALAKNALNRLALLSFIVEFRGRDDAFRIFFFILDQQNLVRRGERGRRGPLEGSRARGRISARRTEQFNDLKNGGAFRADNRRALEVEEGRVATQASALFAEFRFRHDFFPYRPCFAGKALFETTSPASLRLAATPGANAACVPRGGPGRRQAKAAMKAARAPVSAKIDMITTIVFT
jgi:hypothetical protein